MIRSYLTIMFRNVMRQKIYAAITILGLTFGITFTLCIGVFVWSELQVNQDLKDVDRLYLVEVEDSRNEGSMLPFFVPAILGQRAVQQYPNIIENMYRFRDRSITVSKDDKHLRIQSMIGDSTLIEMFGFKVVDGVSKNALSDPSSMVISEHVALQFFNRVNVAGETVTVSTENNGRQDYHITAVIENPADKNSVSDFMNMDAQIFLSHANRANFNLGGIDDWEGNIITYIKVAPNITGEYATGTLNKLLQSEAPENIREAKVISLAAIKNYYLVTNHGAVEKLMYGLGLISGFILFLAITNFINITIARSFSRLKEVGIRTVMGGQRKDIMFQFLGEGMLFAITSGICSLVLYELLHGYFGTILETTLPSILDFQGPLWMAMISGTMLIGLLAGLYPALYIASLKTTDSLKGKLKSIKGTLRLSRTLVITQFFVAVVIFTAAFIMSKQVSFFLEADQGYDKSHVLIVSSVPRLWSEDGFNKMDVAKKEFLSSSKVEAVSLSWGSPNFNFSPYSAKIARIGNPTQQGVRTVICAADEDYAKVFGLTIQEGTFLFNAGTTRMMNHIAVNESAQKALNLEIGDKISIEYSDQEFTIVGIVKDFHFESFHKPIEPLVFIHTRDYTAFRYFSFKLAPGSISQSVKAVEAQWKKVFPNDPFVYNFTDDRLSIVYKTELQLKSASVASCFLILIIVLTGVLGLVSLNVAKRKKEIGIRKVLGAEVADILVLVSREYAAIMLVAFGLGVPISFLFGTRWLNNFAYHIALEWWLFTIPLLLLFIFTILLVVLQSLRTALSNPVNSLRYE